MSRRTARTILLILAALHGGTLIARPASGAEPTVSFPLKASADGRFFVDARDRPFFYHADTAWGLPKKLTLAEAESYFDDRVARGFTAVQLQTFSKEQGPMTNREGRNPFDPPDDILAPDQAYWRHLDQVLAAARKRELLVAVAPLWIRWGGKDKEGWRGQLTEQNAGPYGQFLGRRYKHLDNLIWILGGDANPKEKADAIRAMAEGIRQTAPHHLLTVHNAPENSSAEHFGDDKWLDVNMAYSYREVQPHVLAEYRDRKPPRPIILGESGYEEEDNDKRGGDAWRMRRQAYGAILCGSVGGHAFGQKHVWRFDADWRAGLDSPASRQMGHVKALFAARHWHALVPDADNRLVVAGRGTAGEVSYVSVAATPDGALAIAYLPAGGAVTIDLARLAGPALARWFDPTNGKYEPVDPSAVANNGRREYRTKGKNAAGADDFLLVFEASPDKPKP